MKQGGKNTIAKVLFFSVILGLVSGCATQTRVLTQGAPDTPATLGLSGNDFERAAGDAVQSMLVSGAVDRSDGKKNIMVVSSIINDTMQRLDTDQLVKKIRIELLRSGKVMTTTAIGLNGSEDQMNAVYDQLSKSKKVDKNSVVKQAFAAPNMSLSGKIIQRNNRINKKEQLVEYYFQLTLTDLQYGLAVWEGETPIQKIGSAKGTSW